MAHSVFKPRAEPEPPSCLRSALMRNKARGAELAHPQDRGWTILDRGQAWCCPGFFRAGTSAPGARPFLTFRMDPGLGAVSRRVLIGQVECDRVADLFRWAHQSDVPDAKASLITPCALGFVFDQEFRKRVDTPVRVVRGGGTHRQECAGTDGKGRKSYEWISCAKATYEVSPEPPKIL